MQSLHEQINLELRKLCTEDEAFGWLSSPQKLLNSRIPARMMATGEGAAVLEALKSAAARKIEIKSVDAKRSRTSS